MRGNQLLNSHRAADCPLQLEPTAKLLKSHISHVVCDVPGNKAALQNVADSELNPCLWTTLV